MGPPWQQAGALGEAFGMTRFGGLGVWGFRVEVGHAELRLCPSAPYPYEPEL